MEGVLALHGDLAAVEERGGEGRRGVLGGHEEEAGVSALDAGNPGADELGLHLFPRALGADPDGERRLLEGEVGEAVRLLTPHPLRPPLVERAGQGERILGPEVGVLLGITEDGELESKVAADHVARRIAAGSGADRPLDAAEHRVRKARSPSSN